MSRPFGKYAPADVAKFATAVEQRWALIVSVIPRVYLRRRRTEADLGHHCWLPAGGSRHSSKQSGDCTARVLRDRDRGSDQSGRADRIGMELPFVFPTHAILADFIVYEPDE